jgi:hypothetical protein
MKNTTDHGRRAILGALAIGLPTVVAGAYAGTNAAPGTDTSAWDKAFAVMLQAKKVADHIDALEAPLHARISAGRPDESIVPKILPHEPRGFVLNVMDIDRAQRRNPDVPAADFDKLREYRRLREVNNKLYDQLDPRGDAADEALSDATSALMQVPAPHGAAILWKLDHLYGPEAMAPDADAVPSYCMKWMSVFIADVRRLADGEA